MQENNQYLSDNGNSPLETTSNIVTNNNNLLPSSQQGIVTSTPTNPTIEASITNGSIVGMRQQQPCRSESINLTSNNSSINLLSNATQAPDSTSLQTNNSSDCIAAYDSDNCWPLSQESSRSRINTHLGSISNLDRQSTYETSTNEAHFITMQLNSDNTNCSSESSAQQRHFTIGPASDTESNNADNNENFSEFKKSQNIHIKNSSNNVDTEGEIMFDNRNLDEDQVDDSIVMLDQDEDESYDPHKQVIVGICAMEKKAQSKPMKEILRRLEDYFEYIRTLVFEESVILNKPIEEWPLCDCLISFHSKGFPLSKAIEYARLRKPFLVNDLDIQYDIQDRRKVYKILEEADIELPRYAVLDRDSSNLEDRELIESDDHIEVANFVFNKPFVEKPISAEDHNICIYYPAHAGGGSQRLFRKIGCRSSVYSNESHVRKTGSYIYEEFMPTDGTDVKVYTAGPDYAHAEARKSPALDGKVERDMDGKEIRYPVILTNREKLIARKVCLAFKQTVCGFDLLRANGHSYVCDVNGFSFVKSSMKYYEDCSKILGNMMLRALAPQLHIPWSIPFQLDDPPIVPTTFGRMMELRCVVAVIRHGDRTPKQKMKLEVKHPKFFELYQKYGNSKNGQAKLKKPKQLQEVLDIARYLLGELPEDQPISNEVMEPRVKLKQLKSVLEMYGHFSGINRKVQLKYQPHGRPRRSSSEDEATREPSLVLILKWGGELTPAGRVQAEDLGRCFRRLYPASGDYSGPQGLGLLRLHSTFRHDLKIYASDEGRVQMTAAAFAKGFLALEGELTPILFQMVKSANTNGLLDNDCESSKCQKIVKERLHDIMQKNYDLTPDDMDILNPTNAPSISAACKFISNPYNACEKVYKLIKELNALIRSKRQDNCYTQEYHLYHGETWDLLQRRWAKLEKDFKFKRSKRFDISKIPDIYDCIKYDLQHNQHTLQFQFAHELHAYAKALADIVIPQEYGMTDQEKLMISLGTCSPLLRKIQADLLRNADSTNDDETESVNRLDPKYSHGVSSPDRHVRTRLYFTSESHIHSLVTSLQFGGLLDVKRDAQWQRSMEFLSAISELNYLSQIVIMLYEDPTKEPTSDDRFHVEIHFSSGVINRISQQANMPTEPQGPGFRPHLHNKSYSNASSTGSNTATNLSDQQNPLQQQYDNQNNLTPEISYSNSTMLIRAKMSSMNLSVKQQQADSMIKEEPTDDERSNEDADSKGNSKSSSICMTPKKSINLTLSNEAQDLDLINSNQPTLITKSKTIEKKSAPIGEFSGVIETDNNNDSRTVVEKNVSQPTSNQKSSQKSNQRYLSRSFSANTPISLQDVFKKNDAYIVKPGIDEEKNVFIVSNENVTKDQINDVGTNNEPSSSKLMFIKSNDLVNRMNDDSVKTNNIEKAPQSSSMNQLQQQQLADIINGSELGNVVDGVGQAIERKTTNSHDVIDQDNNCCGNPSDLPLSSPSSLLSQYPRIPEKNNWKTYEQYLASELTTSPQLVQHNYHHCHHHGGGYYYRHRRCCANNQQIDQQATNLPPINQTNHHWNFSPNQTNTTTLTGSTNGVMNYQKRQHHHHHHHQQQHSSSFSMSTSPQQTINISTSPANASGGVCSATGSNIHQRYFAHKQQQQQALVGIGSGSRQYFTMSSSMPIQYKSNSNPRACSVADVSQYCGGPSSLISTAVISGSSPELVAVCPYSPNIRPLETLHNELSLKPFIDFITRLTRNHHRASSIFSTDNNHDGTNTNSQIVCANDSLSSDNVTVRVRSSSQDMTNNSNNLLAGSSNSTKIGEQNEQQQQQQLQQQSKLKKPMTNTNSINNNDSACDNKPLGLSPGNSLSNSLIWSGLPSASSPKTVLDLWSKLELEEPKFDCGVSSPACNEPATTNHQRTVVNNDNRQQQQQLPLSTTATCSSSKSLTNCNNNNNNNNNLSQP